MYLLTDGNHVILPDEDTEKFDDVEFHHNGHYKVVGIPKVSEVVTPQRIAAPGTYQTSTVSTPGTSTATPSAASGK